MPLIRKSELLSQTEGIPAVEQTTWAGSDAVDVLELQFGQSRELIPRQPAIATLSTVVEAIGRGSVSTNFGVDFKGSGTKGTAPDYSNLLSSCLMTQGVLTFLDLATHTQKTRVGDLITGATSGATALVFKTSSAESLSILILKLSGTFTTSETLNSTYLGGALGTADAATPEPAGTEGLFWKPGSQPSLQFAITGAWSGSNPGIGETVTVTTAGGLIEGSGTFVISTASVTALEWNWGTISASSTLLSTSGKTATVHATPAILQLIGLSQTMRPNRDGLARPMIGCKGTFAINGEAGGQGKIAFTFTGKPGSPTDIGLQSGTSFATTVPPRLIASDLNIDGVSYPTKSFQLDLNNTVIMRADANSSEGDLRAEITGRDPGLTIEIDQVGVAALDLWAKWEAGTLVNVSGQLGTAVGNTMSFIARSAQIESIDDGDADGIGTHTVVFKLRKTLAGGDDEFYLGHG